MYKPEKLLNRYFVFIWIVAFALQTGQNVFNSIIAVYANSFGYSNTFAGALSIPYLIGAVIGRTAGGWISDKRGRRAGILIGTSCFLAASLLFALPIAKYPVSMIVLRFIHGIGYAAGTTSLLVAAVDVTPQEKRAVGMGVNFTGMGVAFALAGVLVGMNTAGGRSFMFLFLLTSVFVAASVFFGSVSRYENGQIPEKKTEKEKKPFFSDLISVPALPYALIIIVYYSSQALIAVYLVSLAVHKGMEDVSGVFTLCAVGMVVSSLLFPRLSARFGPLAGMFPVCLGGLAGFFIFLYTKSEPVFILSGLLYGVSLSGLPILQDAALKTTPVYERGSVMATLWLATDLAMGVTPIFWGMLIDKNGFALPFGVAAILFAVTYALHVGVDIFCRKKKNNPS